MSISWSQNAFRVTQNPKSETRSGVGVPANTVAYFCMATSDYDGPNVAYHSQIRFRFQTLDHVRHIVDCLKLLEVAIAPEYNTYNYCLLPKGHLSPRLAFVAKDAVAP